MLELRSLGLQNFQSFVDLLKERGEAPEDYYRWKYLDQVSYGKPTGFIAYVNGSPAGCVGIVNRMYCTSDGRKFPATWFADWYVKDAARGKRIGQRLLERVLGVSDYSFGIPGPPRAQKVCQQSGYKFISGLYQYTLYLNPFRCGFRRFSGGYANKVLRGVKSSFISIPAWSRRQVLSSKVSIMENPSVDELWHNLKAKRNGGSRLSRDYDYFQWFSHMPTAACSERQWWSVESSDLFSFGFIDTDFWGLRKAVVLDFSTSINEVRILEIARALSQSGADWISFCYLGGLSIKHWSKTALPLYASTPSNLNDLLLTDMDKDSSWRSLLFS